MGKYLLKEVSKHSKGEPEYIKKNKRLYLKDMAFLISIAIMEETVMKRRAVKSVLCAALMALTLSMTACGGSDDAAKDAATEEQEEASEEEAEEPEEEAPEEAEKSEEEAPEEEAEEPEEEKAAEATANTLEEYLNSTDGAMEAVEEQIAGSNGDGMSVSGEVKGNDFTFNFTIEDASLITDDTAAQLEAGLDATASVFEEMAGQMDDEVGLDRGSIQVVIKYCDPDGNVLAERGFKAQ
jgi:type IV secretory pathway VirB10-like protein